MGRQRLQPGQGQQDRELLDVPAAGRWRQAKVSSSGQAKSTRTPRLLSGLSQNPGSRYRETTTGFTTSCSPSPRIPRIGNTTFRSWWTQRQQLQVRWLWLTSMGTGSRRSSPLGTLQERSTCSLSTKISEFL